MLRSSSRNDALSLGVASLRSQEITKAVAGRDAPPTRSRGRPRYVPGVSVCWFSELLERTEELDEVSQIFFGKDFAKTLGHGGKSSSPGFDIGLLDRDESIVGGVQDQFIRRFTLENAGLNVAVLENDSNAIEPLCDLFVRQDDRFEEVNTILL